MTVFLKKELYFHGFLKYEKLHKVVLVYVHVRSELSSIKICGK